VLVAAPLLPDAGHALDGIVRRGVDRDPGPAPVIGRGDERVPDPRETVRLVVAGHVRADEAAGGAARAAADRLGVQGGLDPVRRADVEVIDPGQAAVMADLDVDMPFGRIAGRNRLVVDVAVISGAVAVDRHGGIGPLGLGHAPADHELAPGGARIGARHAPLSAVALPDRQPGRAVRCYVHVAVQTAAALGTAPRIGRHAGTPGHAEVEAALAHRWADDVLRAVQRVLALIQRGTQDGQGRGKRSGSDRLVIGAAVGRAPAYLA